jgi:hypothetical protein
MVTHAHEAAPFAMGERRHNLTGRFVQDPPLPLANHLQRGNRDLLKAGGQSEGEVLLPYSR